MVVCGLQGDEIVQDTQTCSEGDVTTNKNADDDDDVDNLPSEDDDDEVCDVTYGLKTS